MKPFSSQTELSAPSSSTPALAIFGLAATRGPADRVLHELKVAGYPNTVLSILFLDYPLQGMDASSQFALPSNEIRGVVAWIADARAIKTTKHSLIAAGPVADSIDRASPGSVAEALRLLGVRDADASLYEERVLKNEFLIAVHVDSEAGAASAREVMEGAGAEEISQCQTVAST